MGSSPDRHEAYACRCRNEHQESVSHKSTSVNNRIRQHLHDTSSVRHGNIFNGIPKPLICNLASAQLSVNVQIEQFSA